MIFFQVGRLLRFVGHVKKIVSKLHTSLKFVTSGALLVMFWVKISQATAKGNLEKFSPLMIFAVTALGTAVITSFLLSTFVFCYIVRLPMKSTLAVTVLSSARNSSIAIAVIESLPHSVGNKDLMFFPIIFVYLAMIVLVNSFGAFMKIKKEENDIEQGKDTHDNTITKENREILPLLESSASVETKLSLVINPLEKMISCEKPNANV